MDDPKKIIFIGKLCDLEYKNSEHLFFIAQNNCLMIFFSVIKIYSDLNYLSQIYFVNPIYSVNACTMSHNLSFSIYPDIIKKKYREE